jgi:type IV pilus assembly protein PilE
MKNRTPLSRSVSDRGFTLIELMIVVVIIGILAAIAYPSFSRYVIESRRAEAQSEMLRIQLGMEKWRANNNAYTATLSQAGFTDTNSHYNYSITGNTASAYTINAAAQGAQATADSACTPLTLNQSGVKGPAGCWKGNTGS